MSAPGRRRPVVPGVSDAAAAVVDIYSAAAQECFRNQYVVIVARAVSDRRLGYFGAVGRTNVGQVERDRGRSGPDAVRAGQRVLCHIDVAARDGDARRVDLV